MSASDTINPPRPIGSEDRKWLVEARTALTAGGFGVDDDGCILRDGRVTSLMLAPVLGDGAVYVCESGAGGTRYWRGSPSSVCAVVHWLLSYDGSWPQRTGM